jgi:hypothetical protein
MGTHGGSSVIPYKPGSPVVYQGQAAIVVRTVTGDPLPQTAMPQLVLQSPSWKGTITVDVDQVIHGFKDQ